MIANPSILFCLVCAVLHINVLSDGGEEGNVCIDNKNKFPNNMTRGWEHIPDHNLQFHRPHCLDKRNVYKLEQCSTESPKCEKLQKDASLCPDDSTYHSDFGCVLLLPKAKFADSKCPYGFAKLAIEMLRTFPAQKLWFPARRIEHLGEYVYAELGSHYGSTFSWPIPYNDEDCLIHYDNVIMGASCNDSYGRLCVYGLLNENRNRHCKKELGAHCMDSQYSYSNECICAEDVGEYCEFAALEQPYQNAIGKLRAGCNLALEVRDQLYWAETGKAATYTYWSYTDVDVDMQNAILLKNDGWMFAANNEATCNICKVELNTKSKPSIKLRYNSYTAQLNMKIINPDSLAILGGNDESIFCFTDAQPASISSVFKILKAATNTLISISDSGHYWCEAFYVNGLQHIKSNQLLIIVENIFTLQILMKYDSHEDPTTSHIAYQKYINSIEYYYNNVQRCERKIRLNWVKTLSVDADLHQVLYLVHARSDMSHAHMQDFVDVKDCLQKTLRNIGGRILHASELSNSEYCLAGTSTTAGNYVLSWNTTKINKIASANELCLSSNRQQITRKCLWDFYKGAYWGLHEECSPYERKTSEHTELLLGILASNLTSQQIVDELHVISNNSLEFEPIDILLAANLLYKVRHDVMDLQTCTNVISNLMNSRTDVLQTAQQELKATDAILRNHDVILHTNKDRCIDDIYVTSQLITFIFNTKHTNYQGLALINNKPVKLPATKSLEEIMTMQNLQMAAYIPKSVLMLDATIVINIYLKPTLFNTANGQQITANAFGILLPIERLPEALQLVFNPIITNIKCSYWYFSANYSRWLAESAPTTIKHLTVCRFKHVTHFGLLISKNIIISAPLPLQIITGIECGLSILGIIGIYITAALFHTWRLNKGNILLLHYASMYLLQIIMLYVSYTIKTINVKALCIIVGSALHYTVVAQFCWMLLIAYLQYQRYVLILHNTNEATLIKYIWVMYFVPTLPIIPLLLVSPDDYNYSQVQLCYPTGISLEFAVLMPICLILVANILIFARIFFELFRGREMSKCSTVSEDFSLKLRLVVLLFFILGISWVFGFFAEVFQSAVLLYLFSMAVSIQGFVMFVFFILLNGNVRLLYAQLWSKYGIQD